MDGPYGNGRDVYVNRAESIPFGLRIPPPKAPPRAPLVEPGAQVYQRPQAPPQPPTPCAETVFPGCPPPECAPALVKLDPRSWNELLEQAPALATEPSPYHAPPFQATTLLLRRRAVVNVPIGVDAIGNEGGLMLAIAEEENISGVSVPAFEPTAVGAFVELLPALQIQDDETAVFTRLRMASDSYAGMRALRLQINVSGRAIVETLPTFAVTISPPDIMGPDQDGKIDIPVYIPVPARRRISILVANHDRRAGHLVEIALDGWRWPVVVPGDSAMSAMVRNDPTVPLPDCPPSPCARGAALPPSPYPPPYGAPPAAPYGAR